MKKLFLLLPIPFLFGCEPQTPRLSLQVEATNKKYLHCNDTVPDGFPQFTQSNAERDAQIAFSCHDKFTMVYDTEYKFAYWTAEHLDGKTLEKYEHTERRQDRLRPDTNFPAYITDLESQFDNAVDQGYLYRPLVFTDNWKGDQRAMSQTYYWSNMFLYPRDEANVKADIAYNQYLEKIEKENKNKPEKEQIVPKTFTPKPDSLFLLWKNIDNNVIAYTKKYGESYVFSGVIPYRTKEYPYGITKRFGIVKKAISFQQLYDEGAKAKGKEWGVGLGAATYVFKMIYFPQQNQSIVYVVPNISKNISLDPEKYRQSLTTLEKISGINFFPKVKK